ncbi:bleomycin resistance protein [Nocardioides flavus (ex Wang et al. 2016)]|uniref:Bleomycin resistance protein n=1 Tax=Nocardioides flavus (ex Wang et al. 2016) TaxID=2058780 RepID=A0ABQ3HIF8_9ACTN|nr:VOC family protein [Nocardioides flavus (ex Wang et al. 2016)]GHE15722.1 bleomycin resistance protein [Nocardioides flavus (ex Wang et al. 2016)]
MADHATPNLPCRDLDATAAFFGSIGFAETYRNPGWLIVERGGLKVEFFRDPTTDPTTTSAGCCLRVDDLDGLYAALLAAGLPETHLGWPRLHPPQVEASGMRIGHLVDPDGNQLRLVQNP